MSSIKIKTPDGFLLDADFKEVKGSNKGIIFAHGMIVDRDDEGIFVRAEPELNKLGFSTLRFDFRAHGKSSGNSITDFTISGELKDLDSVVNFMKSKGITWLGLCGASFGGGIVSLYVSSYPGVTKALFLANPAMDFESGFLNPTTLWAMKNFANVYSRIKNKGFIEVASRKFRMGKALFDEMKIYNPCLALRNYKGKLMVVHGDKDDKVSVKTTQECFNQLPNDNKELVILKGAEHGFHTEPYESQVVKMIIKFFEQFQK